MNYSFFGTCSDDYEQLFGCLKTILIQTILPEEIILVNAGSRDIKETIQKNMKDVPIKLIYIFRKLPRVNSLNLALSHSSSHYSFRFDSRSRFANDYSENALKTLMNKSVNAAVVGGVPSVLSENKKFQPVLCSNIMSRSYTFFYPKHRRPFFNGYASSVYLGCFLTSLLKKIKFCETNTLISEDSLIIKNFIEKGYKVYLCKDINVSYLCRSSFKKLIKLFNTYGYCRANTILFTKNLFISSRHLIVFFIYIFIQLLILKKSIFLIFIFPIIILIFNLFGEILSKGKINLYTPIFASLCQFSWVLGFLWRIMTILKKTKSKSNFIS
tara:strand:- start:47 stop:1027 length:981 start_codon:yes stop_codon:yes gene_type:complete